MIKIPHKKKLATLGISAGVAVAGYIGIPFEGEVHHAYRDSGGVTTACMGHTGNDIVAGKTYSHEDCVKLYAKDAKQAERYVRSSVGGAKWDALPAEVQGSMIDFVFNVGIGNTRRKTNLIQLLKNDQLFQACTEMRTDRVTDAQGHELRGLHLRREKESDTCLDGLQ